MWARVTEAVASLLVHVDEPAREVVDEDRLARLLDEMAETPLALAQRHLGLLAFGGVAREGRHPRRFAAGRVAQQEQVPIHRDRRARFITAKTGITHPAARAHERGHDRAQEERPVLAHEVFDDARAAGFLQAVETDQPAAGLVEVVDLAVEVGQRDEIGAGLDELLQTGAGKLAVVAAFEFGAQALVEPGQFAHAGFERGAGGVVGRGCAEVVVDGEEVGGAPAGGQVGRQADGWGNVDGERRQADRAFGGGRCGGGSLVADEADEFGQEAAVLGTQLARPGIEQAEAPRPFAAGAARRGRILQENRGQKAQTRLTVVQDDRRTEPGKARVVIEIGHHEEVFPGRVEQVAVVQRLGDERVGREFVAVSHLPACGAALENDGGGHVEQAGRQRGDPPVNGEPGVGIGGGVGNRGVHGINHG